MKKNKQFKIRELSNKQVNESLKLAVINLYDIDKKFKACKKEYDEKKLKLTTKIKNYLFTNGLDGVSFVACAGDEFANDPKHLRCVRHQSMSVIFDADKLEKKLGKEAAMNYIDKEYRINDIDGFISLCKSYGMKPTEVKKFINVEKSVNKTRLEQDEELGDISMDDVEGCYTIKKNEPYLKIGIIKE